MNLPSSAVIVAGPNGQGNATAASLDAWAVAGGLPGFTYWENVVRVSDASGIYLGAAGTSGWVMTAAHVTGLGMNSPASTISISGNNYQVHESVKLPNVDLRMYRVGGEAGDPPLPDLEVVPLMDAKPAAGESVLIFGAGGRLETTEGTASNSDIAMTPGVVTNKFEGTGASVLRWGTNTVDVGNMSLGYDSFLTRFDTSLNYLTSTEAALTLGDSGGPVFVRTDDGWALTGINAFVAGSPNAAAFGDYSGFVSVGKYGGMISSNFVPEPSVGMMGIAGGLLLLGGRRRR